MSWPQRGKKSLADFYKENQWRIEEMKPIDMSVYSLTQHVHCTYTTLALLSFQQQKTFINSILCASTYLYGRFKKVRSFQLHAFSESQSGPMISRCAWFLHRYCIPLICLHRGRKKGWTWFVSHAIKAEYCIHCAIEQHSISFAVPQPKPFLLLIYDSPYKALLCTNGAKFEGTVYTTCDQNSKHFRPPRVLSAHRQQQICIDMQNKPRLHRLRFDL